MRINFRLKIKQNFTPQVTRVMVTWLEIQGDQRFMMTRDFESRTDAALFSARMDRPVEIEEVYA